MLGVGEESFFRCVFKSGRRETQLKKESVRFKVASYIQTLWKQKKGKHASIRLAYIWTPWSWYKQHKAKVNFRCCYPVILAFLREQLLTYTFAWKGFFISLLVFIRVTCLRKYQINISFIATFFVIASLWAKPSSVGGGLDLQVQAALLFSVSLKKKPQWERHTGQVPTTQDIASSLSGTSHPLIIIEIHVAANFPEDSNAPSSRSSQRRVERAFLSPLPFLVKYVYLQENA